MTSEDAGAPQGQSSVAAAKTNGRLQIFGINEKRTELYIVTTSAHGPPTMPPASRHAPSQERAGARDQD